RIVPGKMPAQMRGWPFHIARSRRDCDRSGGGAPAQEGDLANEGRWFDRDRAARFDDLDPPLVDVKERARDYILRRDEPSLFSHATMADPDQLAELPRAQAQERAEDLSLLLAQGERRPVQDDLGQNIKIDREEKSVPDDVRPVRTIPTEIFVDDIE